MIIMTTRNITFEKWAVDLTRTLKTLTIPIPHQGVSKWWEWANLLVALNHLYNLPLSNRQLFPKEEDWRKWADLFIQDIQAIQFNH